MHILSHETIAQTELERLAELIAPRLIAGDCLALVGDLGAGKSTFARALVKALLGDPSADVPSPTFPIVITYERQTSKGTAVPIAHYDWYRLSDDTELDEIGFDDSQPNQITLVEWPDRLPNALPTNHLRVELQPALNDAEARSITIARHGDIQKPERFDRLHVLFDAAMHVTPKVTRISHMTGDASSRSYARLHLADGTTAILMDNPAMPDGAPLADGRPYSRHAKLAETIEPFLNIATGLREAHLSAPMVLLSEARKGWAVLEDLGDQPFDHLVRADGNDQRQLWLAALDTLIALRARLIDLDACPQWVTALPPIDTGVMDVEVALFCDWAVELGSPAQADDRARSAYIAAWNAALAEFTRAPDQQNGVMLRDYHSPNLMWLPDRRAHQRVGVIDFQDALRGPWAYDVVSLCQDARVDVSPMLEHAAKAHYVSQMQTIDPQFCRETFDRHYAILGAQRAAKIIGIFHRLDKRDGKPGYKVHLPRVIRYLQTNLEHPALKQVRHWFATNAPHSLEEQT
ncbi:MAG: tRNA (adenosine(37)-N6)-threonylcarbamoyltransferase complex ATPase subunit type 1 TsaE [Pseudomonadota bacterium]